MQHTIQGVQQHTTPPGCSFYKFCYSECNYNAFLVSWGCCKQTQILTVYLLHRMILPQNCNCIYNYVILQFFFQLCCLLSTNNESNEHGQQSSNVQPNFVCDNVIWVTNNYTLVRQREHLMLTETIVLSHIYMHACMQPAARRQCTKACTCT